MFITRILPILFKVKWRWEVITLLTHFSVNDLFKRLLPKFLN